MNEKKNTTKQRPRKRKKNKIGRTLLYLLSIVLVSAVLAVSAILLSNDLLALAKEDREITITIPENATIDQVSELLDNSGVVNYGTEFRLFTKLVYKNLQFRPGMWTLNSSMDYRQIVNEIRLSNKSTVTVTIPEGYTIKQIINTLVENGLSSKDELTDTLQNGTFNYDYLPEELGNETNRLEGYLFPDTYEFYLSDSATTIINKMMGNFENKINDKSQGESIKEICERKEMSIADAINIAAMIEKEAVDAEDMYQVSGVIHNRLNHKAEYPYLNIDATIQYAVGHLDLTDADMKSDSPYNTYTSKGLPPGPICNPGINAIRSAVNPAEHDYYYYVANEDNTSHIYAKSQEEQTANIRAVQEKKNNK